MKPQDVFFAVVFGALLLLRKPQLLVWAGLVSLILAIPLFATWTFFTAQRFTWYAAAFFVTAILISTFFRRRVQ